MSTEQDDIREIAAIGKAFYERCERGIPPGQKHQAGKDSAGAMGAESASPDGSDGSDAVNVEGASPDREDPDVGTD